ncbi:MAG TPA: ABC transporter permease [Candidatus Binatia bacterium]|nr:ABC transporter permease [Candidatus Binatia bacterium]
MADVTQTAGTARPRPPGVVAAIGAGALELLQVTGECAALFAATVWHCRSAPRHIDKIIAQLTLIGTETLGIAALVSLFVGMVMVVQAADQLANYTQEVLGSLVGLAMTKELGPVIMGFIVAGKSGSAIAAEIGSMKVYDEIAALRTMDIDPVPFLSMPRFVAMTLALPMLVLYSDVIGIVGGTLVIAFDPTISISVSQFLDNLREWLNLTDIVVGLVKGAVFGMLVSIIACAFGLRTTGGSQGVARSTTSAVVWSFVSIIIADFIIVRIAFLFFPATPK